MKKILQIHTANFAISEINKLVPPVSLKAELTVYWLIAFLETPTFKRPLKLRSGTIVM